MSEKSKSWSSVESKGLSYRHYLKDHPSCLVLPEEKTDDKGSQQPFPMIKSLYLGQNTFSQKRVIGYYTNRYNPTNVTYVLYHTIVQENIHFNCTIYIISHNLAHCVQLYIICICICSRVALSVRNNATVGAAL